MDSNNEVKDWFLHNFCSIKVKHNTFKRQCYLPCSAYMSSQTLYLANVTLTDRAEKVMPFPGHGWLWHCGIWTCDLQTILFLLWHLQYTFTQKMGQVHLYWSAMQSYTEQKKTATEWKNENIGIMLMLYCCLNYISHQPLQISLSFVSIITCVSHFTLICITIYVLVSEDLLVMLQLMCFIYVVFHRLKSLYFYCFGL